MALQFYNAGFFNPQYADQTKACIEMMDFQGKQSVLDTISANGGMYQQLLQTEQQLLQQAEIIDKLAAKQGIQSNQADQMAAQINQNLIQERRQARLTPRPTAAERTLSCRMRGARHQTHRGQDDRDYLHKEQR